MQWSSRIHIKVKSPKVWEKLADIDLNRYYIYGKGNDIFSKNSTSFIINGDWGCDEGKLVALVKKIAEILKNECIIIADCTNINVDPYSCIVYYFGNDVHTPSYSVLNERWYSHKVRKEKRKLWELHFNANINDITEYINYNLFFPREIDKIEGEQLRDFGINIEKFYVFDKELVHYCGNNSAISIPNGVEKISEILFLHCDWIEKVYIPEGVIIIDKEAFNMCRSLKEINIPDSVNEIKEYAFLDCETLQEIKIPENVTKIRKGVFQGCKSLKKVELPEEIIEIGDNAFTECIELQEIKIPKNVTKIGKEAFSGCKSLKKIELPEGIIEIKKQAFANCKSLREVNIPDSLIKIGKDVFSGCKYLDEKELIKKVKNNKEEKNE